MDSTYRECDVSHIRLKCPTCVQWKQLEKKIKYKQVERGREGSKSRRSIYVSASLCDGVKMT